MASGWLKKVTYYEKFPLTFILLWKGSFKSELKLKDGRIDHKTQKNRLFWPIYNNYYIFAG